MELLLYEVVCTPQQQSSKLRNSSDVPALTFLSKDSGLLRTITCFSHCLPKISKEYIHMYTYKQFGELRILSVNLPFLLFTNKQTPIIFKFQPA